MILCSSDMSTEQIERFWKSVTIPIDTSKCWEWSSTRDRKGYGLFSVRSRFNGAHRISYLLHYGSIAPGLMVLHSCDNPSCVNPIHLRQGTAKDNAADMVGRGRLRFMIGEKAGRSKLTEEKVLIIRSMAGKISQRDMAQIFSVSRISIQNVVRNRTWKHVKGGI